MKKYILYIPFYTYVRTNLMYKGLCIKNIIQMQRPDDEKYKWLFLERVMWPTPMDAVWKVVVILQTASNDDINTSDTTVTDVILMSWSFESLKLLIG